jgi:phosphinothricin acetyltransferase
MEALFAQARLAGIHALFAGVSAENDPGIAFHARLGFREVGRLPEAGRKFDRWLTLVLMQKMLSE